MTQSFAEQLFGKRFKDLSPQEKLKYQAEYKRYKREGLEVPKRNEYNRSRAEYRRKRRERGLDRDHWNEVEANRRASSHTHKVRKRHGEHISSKITTKELAQWWEAQEKVCYLCGDEGKDFDHIIPLSRGGEHSLSNLRICCTSCNSVKSGSTPEELLASIPNKREALEKQLAAIQTRLDKLDAMEGRLRAAL